MENRFLETDAYLKQSARRGKRRSPIAHAQSAPWVQSMSAADRRLVILIENGGIDLGIPAFVDALLRVTPGASLLPDSVRQQIVDFLRTQIKKTTDSLIETAELSINRYSAAKPGSFGDVTILRDGTASYQDLKRTLGSFSSDGRIIDLLILTHGSSDYISVKGGVDGDKIRAIKAEHGKPLSIRSVYMMNCVGSSLNQAWIDAGAKVSSGALRNNYLPEPTTFFFWKAWLAGQSFENAVTGAYRKTINLLNDALRTFVAGLPFPGTSMLAKAIDVEKLDVVRDSAPVIQGQRSVTIGSDDLSFASTISSSMATTVLPVGLLRALQQSAPPAASAATGKLSAAGLELLKQWEWPQGTPSAEDVRALMARVGEAERALQESVSAPLNAHQVDALISFICNVGVEAFRRSKLLRFLNQADPLGAVAELRQWTKARHNGGVIDVPALVTRRNAEAELFQRPAAGGTALASSLSCRYEFHSPSQVVTQQSGNYSQAQSPMIAGIAIADAAQVGLGAVAVVQAQVIATQGSFSLTFDKAQRLLTSEARAQMPGSQTAKKSYSTRLFKIDSGTIGQAEAEIVIVWEGNAYGEIGTVIIRRNLSTSTEWSKSSASFVITKLDRIPLPNTDPRTWPIAYTYEGSYDPIGNGHWEFGGEFEVNAFGGLKFTRHEVVSRSLLDLTLGGKPEDYVKRGKDVVVAVPDVPAEQLAYLKTKLP